MEKLICASVIINCLNKQWNDSNTEKKKKKKHISMKRNSVVKTGQAFNLL